MRRTKGKLRVEVETPDGHTHRAEESLSTTLTELITNCERDPSAENKLRVLDNLVEKGSRLWLTVAGAVSRALGTR